MQEFRYELGWPAHGIRPGHHRSLGRGGGFEFKEQALLAADPDPRRLDLHASLRDPFGQFKVRVFRERRAITVQVLADLSASLGFGASSRKLIVLADFVEAAAYSAFRTGDSFGFLGAANTVFDALRVPPSRAKGLGIELGERLRRWQAQGDTAQGLLAAAGELGRRRSLVFLVSDFHLPQALLEQVLAALERHAVVPVVLWDPAEYTLGRRWGLRSVRDLEGGARRTLLVRPAFAERVMQGFRRRQRELEALFLRHGTRALSFPAGFDAERVTRYFVGEDAWPPIAP